MFKIEFDNWEIRERNWFGKKPMWLLHCNDFVQWPVLISYFFVSKDVATYFNNTEVEIVDYYKFFITGHLAYSAHRGK